jgi:hypothetical protein
MEIRYPLLIAVHHVIYIVNIVIFIIIKIIVVVIFFIKIQSCFVYLITKMQFVRSNKMGCRNLSSWFDRI